MTRAGDARGQAWRCRNAMKRQGPKWGGRQLSTCDGVVSSSNFPMIKLCGRRVSTTRFAGSRGKMLVLTRTRSPRRRLICKGVLSVSWGRGGRRAAPKKYSRSARREGLPRGKRCQPRAVSTKSEHVSRPTRYLELKRYCTPAVSDISQTQRPVATVQRRVAACPRGALGRNLV